MQRERNILKRSVKALAPVYMKIGPFFCEADLPMKAMSVNLNYLVTAALWP